MSNLYTNTSNLKAIFGLVLTTVLVSYASSNATEIVGDVKSLAKKGLHKAEDCLLHHGKKQYYVCAKDYDGHYYDTGRKVWLK